MCAYIDVFVCVYVCVCLFLIWFNMTSVLEFKNMFGAYYVKLVMYFLTFLLLRTITCKSLFKVLII